MERELWMPLYAMAVRLGKNEGCWRFSATDIVGIYLWCVVHDRPMSWGVNKRNWPRDLCPKCLPSQATLSRRMRRAEIQQLMQAIEEACLGLAGACMMWIRLIDAKPLPVSSVSKDRDARYGRGAGGQQKGYKLYAVWSTGPLPLAWGLADMNTSERTMARHLIPSLPGSGYLLGDAEYDSNPLHDLAHLADHQLLAPKRKAKGGLGHHRHSPYRLRSIELLGRAFGRALFKYRRQIEREFGNLTSFGGGLASLPAWVRRFPRVRNWVHAKLLINASRWFHIRPDAPALA